MTVRSLLTGRLDDQAGGLPDGALGLLGRAATTQWVSPNVAGLASPRPKFVMLFERIVLRPKREFGAVPN